MRAVKTVQLTGRSWTDCGISSALDKEKMGAKLQLSWRNFTCSQKRIAPHSGYQRRPRNRPCPPNRATGRNCAARPPESRRPPTSESVGIDTSTGLRVHGCRHRPRVSVTAARERSRVHESRPRCCCYGNGRAAGGEWADGEWPSAPGSPRLRRRCRCGCELASSNDWGHMCKIQGPMCTSQGPMC